MTSLILKHLNRIQSPFDGIPETHPLWNRTLTLCPKGYLLSRFHATLPEGIFNKERTWVIQQGENMGNPFSGDTHAAKLSEREQDELPLLQGALTQKGDAIFDHWAEVWLRHLRVAERPDRASWFRERMLIDPEYYRPFGL
jgi:hypothetical protein